VTLSAICAISASSPPARAALRPGAPYTDVTTKAFLSHFGFDTLCALPGMEALEDAGLLSKEKLLAGDFLPRAGTARADDDDMA
jgi:segregation and condensation protein B